MSDISPVFCPNNVSRIFGEFILGPGPGQPGRPPRGGVGTGYLLISCRDTDQSLLLSGPQRTGAGAAGAHTFQSQNRNARCPDYKCVHMNISFPLLVCGMVS